MRKKTGILLCITAAFLLAGCGSKVSTKSPESVVKSLVSAYQSQDQKAVKKCFGLDPDKECAEEIQKEIDYNLSCFKAREAERVNFEASDSLGEFEKMDLVYVWYNYEIKSNKETQKFPSLSFYYVNKKDKEYYVVPAKDVTEEMSQVSRKQYKEFMKTDDYKEYEKAYKAFTKENPKYESSLQNN